MGMNTHTAILGRREYPCCPTRSTKAETTPGVYSRKCPRCGTYWLLIVEPAQLATRLPGLLKMRWDTKRPETV